MSVSNDLTDYFFAFAFKALYLNFVGFFKDEKRENVC